MLSLPRRAPSSDLLAHGCWAGTTLSLLQAPRLVAGSVAPCAYTTIRLVHTSPRWWCGRRWGRTRRRGRRWGRTRGCIRVDPIHGRVHAIVDSDPSARVAPGSGSKQCHCTVDLANQWAATVSIASGGGIAIVITEDADRGRVHATHLAVARAVSHNGGLRLLQSRRLGAPIDDPSPTCDPASSAIRDLARGKRRHIDAIIQGEGLRQLDESHVCVWLPYNSLGGAPLPLPEREASCQHII